MFLENYGEINVSLTLSNVKDTQKSGDVLVEKITEIHYESKDKNPPRHSEGLKN